MNLRTIRLSVVVLVVSAVLLAASVSEAQALERQAAFCGSGRCVRATGTLMGFSQGHLMASSPCLIMLDLVNMYLAADHPNMPPGGGWVPVRIEYGRWSIHAYGLTGAPMEFHMYLGLPGGATLRVYPPGVDAVIVFVGFASFYNRMEYVPWW